MKKSLTFRLWQNGKINPYFLRRKVSLMLTSLLLGLIVMVLYKPRTWCAFCPMGTMTQGICKLKNKE